MNAMKKIWITDLGKMNYKKALKIQETLMFLRQKGELEDTLLLVEHPHVITLGRRADVNNIVVSGETLSKNGIEIIEVNRGGDVTYHGPGQIVGYPVFDLTDYGRDIRAFVRNIEEIFLRMLEKEFDIHARTDEKKYTGVWVENYKITAIGIAVKKWVTMHGFAFNVSTDLKYFDWIVPCGLYDRGVTSLEKLLGIHPQFEELKKLTIKYFCDVFGVKPKIITLNQLESEFGRHSEITNV
jgi:lipoyl(octanoyl) transferase